MEHSHLKTWRTLSFCWIERYSGPVVVVPKRKRIVETLTQSRRITGVGRRKWNKTDQVAGRNSWGQKHWCLRKKRAFMVEENGTKPMGTYYRDWGEIFAGVGAAHRHQNSRSGWYSCVSPSCLWKSNCCLLTLKLSLTPCFFSLHVGIEPCHFKLVSYVSIAGIV